MIVGDKTVRNGITTAASEQQKAVFREVLLDLIDMNFGICKYFNLSLGDVFDVGYVPLKQSPEAAVSRGA